MCIGIIGSWFRKVPYFPPKFFKLGKLLKKVDVEKWKLERALFFFYGCPFFTLWGPYYMHVKLKNMYVPIHIFTRICSYILEVQRLVGDANFVI